MTSNNIKKSVTANPDSPVDNICPMKTTETFDSSGLFDDEDMDDLFADSPKRGAPSQGEHSFVSRP